jgi:hypothetical protein
MNTISRRRFVSLTASGLAAAPLARRAYAIGGSVTAQQVADRIQKSLGGEWKPDTVDGIKAGDPSTAITGIVTTSLASLAVLDKAVKAGANMILATEPAFYNHADSRTPPTRGFGPRATAEPPTPSPPDPVFTGKSDFIDKHKLVIYRLGEHWRLHSPDPFAVGLAETLGWSKFADASNPRTLTIPQMTLEQMVMHVKRSLGSRGGMRVVGNPQLPIRTVALLPGSTAIQASLEVLPKVDAILGGEVREWESVEYVRDTVDLGGKKSLTLVGRVVSEDPGRSVCAKWLKTLVPEVSSTWITAGDPYWRPTA